MRIVFPILFTEKQSEAKFGFPGKKYGLKKLKLFFKTALPSKKHITSLTLPPLPSRLANISPAHSNSLVVPNWSTLENELTCFDESRNEETIQEWSIPYKDLHFEKTASVSHNGSIFKGHWHGEVLIYAFRDIKDDGITNFWSIISQLRMVRHENIELFMGACFELPNLSVITSMRKGPSLHEHIHVKRQVISPPYRINIARQIAQAMGYLHSKGIIHKRLTSNNIILESKVKICLIDQGSEIYNYNDDNYGAVTRGYLSYLSPQLMRFIEVEPPFVKYNGQFGPESDVYAFGTILFELMTGKFPYQRLQSHPIIWLIGSGHHESVFHIKGSKLIRNLVASCWSPFSVHRPAFSQIVKQLQENISLNKQHSCSEPDRLSKIGIF